MTAPPRDAAPPLRRQRRERFWLVLVLLVLALLLALLRWQTHAETDAAERQRLAGQARAVEQNLDRQLAGAAAALRGVRADLAAQPDDARRAAFANARLKALADALPGVQPLHLLDANGHVLASSERQLVGSDFSDRADLAQARTRPDPGVLFVSAPFATAPGVFSLNLSVALLAPDGGFGGIVSATLDPDYFSTVLGSVLYADDMRSTIAHGNGSVMLQVPADGPVQGRNLATPGSPFARHRDSGLQATTLSGADEDGAAAAGGAQRLVAQRTLQPQGLGMDQPLVLLLSRDRTAVFAAWRQRTAIDAALFVLSAAAAWWVLVALQRRRAELERQASERHIEHAADAERLALVLRGGDLGLWDLHLPSGKATVNERWYSMLGHAVGEISPDEEGWLALMHPDDRPRTLAALAAHTGGHTAAYEATFRLRHRDGSWVWIADQGRVVEHDARGAPLRMVGTHMDVTERMQAQDALRRSEQSLAVTLHSIGDAVIATDPQGCITRLNPTAERLTGWPADEAVGQPLAAVFRVLDARTRQPLPDPVAEVLVQGRTPGPAQDQAADAQDRGATLLVARDGRELAIADSAAPIRAASGAVLGVVLVFSDASEQHRMLQALRDREAQLVRVADALPGPVVRIDREHRYVFANAVFEQWFGSSPAQTIGRTRSEVRGAAVAPRIGPQIERALAGERLSFELVITALDGPRHCIVTLVPDRAPDGPDSGAGSSGNAGNEGNGAVRGCFIIVTDISARKRAEDALRHSEQTSRALLGALRSGVVVHGPGTEVLDANPSACRILGLTLDEMRGKTAEDQAWRFVEDDHSQMLPARYPVAQVKASGEPLNNITFGILRPPPEPPRWVLCNAFPVTGDDGALQQIVVTIADITERKLAEEALQRSEARLRMDSRMARLGGWRLDSGTRQPTASPELARLLERGPTLAAQPLDDPDFIAPAHRERFRQCLAAGLQDGQAFDIEVEGHTQSGRSLQLRVLGEAVRDGAGRVVALQGTVQDITESRRAQQQLRLLQAAVARLNDVVIITSVEARSAAPLEAGLADDGAADRGHATIVFVNDAFERLTGWRRSEVLGRSPALLHGPDTDASELARIRQAQAEQQSVRVELVHYNRQGQPYWVDAEMVPLLNAAGQTTHLVAVQRDITERKQSELERRALERQLRQAQKIESIGTLAGGIAHDFNNILAAILGNVGLARDELPAAHPAQVSLEQINRAGLRARSLVQQILSFSRREPNPLRAQPLRPVVEETLSLLRATLPAGVRLDTVLASQPLPVQADATQLQQVLMNLCTNAWHALPDGGGRIEVGLEALPDGAAEQQPGNGGELPAGPLAHVWVRDNGSGIDAATRERIFDPFFTTKPVGHGTGLGLSVVHGIVRGHGGVIAVDSAPGQGSTFHLYFPLVATEPQAAPAAPRGGSALAAPPASSGGRRLLYVDDDEVMVLMVQRLLQRAGYHVDVAALGTQALALVQADPARFDLVISDYNMPEMSGIELTRALAAVRPGLPVIISSGYLADDLRQQADALGVRALLKKEHTLEELPGLVHKVLNEPVA